MKRLLAQESGFRVVAESGDGLEAVRLATELTPDVLVTDLAMPGLHGLEVARRVRRQTPHTRTVIVSVHADEAYVALAFRQGVLGFVRKDETSQHLTRAVRAAAAGRRYLSPSLADVIGAPLLEENPRAQRLARPRLSRRERYALQLAAQGYTEAEVTFFLMLTAAQTTQLRTRLLRKLGLPTDADLAAFSRQNRLLADWPQRLALPGLGAGQLPGGHLGAEADSVRARSQIPPATD